ncbi:Ig-like domain-containing protein [Epilithonimonas sp.]|uniref:Ig-like domain-containing protein n=1 Tax=Epilithonimonas sp. TaxID=2894511 RepID=UPI002FDC9A78
MKKSYILFLVLFFANFFFAQTDIARWNMSSYSPSYNSASHITVGKLTSTVSLSNYDYWIDGKKYNVFATGNWPTPQQAIDYTKYIQFTIKPDVGYKLNLTEFNFRAIMQGNSAKMKIMYSLDSNFSNPQLVAENVDINSSLSTFTYGNFPKPIATDGQELHLRIYVYNTYNVMQILFKENDAFGPLFRGNVESSSTTPVVYNDTYSNFINNDLNLNVLSNDDYSNLVDSINITQPLYGTTKINSDKTVNYLPNEGYVGQDSFSYYIKNKFGKSNTAIVTINNVSNTSSNLIRWDKNDFKGTLQQSFISSTIINNGGGVTIGNGSENTPIFILSNLSSSSKIDPTKYTEFVLHNESTVKTVEPKSFNFTGRGYINGKANYEVRYSKKDDFSSGVFTLASGTFDASFEDHKLSFNSDLKLEPGEKLYIRLYFYKVNGQYVISYLNNAQGPNIEGIFYNYVYSSNGTMWQTIGAKTEWSNGSPNASKNAIIQAHYDTSANGNFESQNLTINTGGTLTVKTGGFIKVNGQIANNNVTANSFTVEHDANLLQTGSASNTGNITVKKSAIIPKMGYNYWSTPVINQNLYQFSEGYNQANGGTRTGTPWNRFYVYNEANDYFVTTIANDITLNSSSVFQPARGYAIRGKNSFPETVTVTSPISSFEFVGTPQNGDVATYNLKWSNAAHGYNMVGNPYPSNISFDDFFAENSSKIYGIGYFWTNNDGRILTQQSSNYSGNNYAIATVVGGTSATYYGSNNGKPNGNISVGQGFIIQAKPAGKNQPLVFKNSMRNSDIANYYNKTAVQKNRFWLEFKSPTDINNEILIGYINNATNGFDSDYDADLLAIGNDSFWSALDGHKLAIQAKDSNFTTEDAARLGFKASVSGNYTISLTQREGIFNSNQAVYLKDKYLNKVINITDNGYVFNTNAGQYEDRFEVVYKSLETLGTDHTAKKEIIISKDTQNFIVKSDENINEVSLYDSVGRLLYYTKNAKKEVLINKTTFAEGMYIIKVNSRNTTMTKKVLK